MQEKYQLIIRTLFGFFVHNFKTKFSVFLKSLVDITYLECQMMDPLSALVNKIGDRGSAVGCLKQLYFDAT